MKSRQEQRKELMNTNLVLDTRSDEKVTQVAIIIIAIIISIIIIIFFIITVVIIINLRRENQ